MDTVGVRVAIMQIRDLNINNVSRLSPSTRCVTAADICKSLGVLNIHISLKDAFSFA
jgi:hypothetical protein